MKHTCRPRVLVLCSTFPRWKSDTVPDFIERLSSSLARRFRIILLAPHYEGARKVERWNGFIVVRYRYFLPANYQRLAYGGGILPNLRRAPWLLLQLPFFLLFGALACRRLQRRYGFRLAHAHWIVPQLFQARLGFLLLAGKPRLLVTSHGGDLWSFRRGIGRWAKHWALKSVSTVSVVSNAMQQPARELNVDCPIRVVPMGTETDIFHPPRIPAPLGKVLFAGRLSEKKGVHIAIRAIAELVDTHLTIIGDGPLRPELERLAIELGVSDRVTFAGWQDRNGLAAAFREHGLFVFPSVITRSGDQEGLGLTLAEAMASGCTVIASTLPAVADLVIDGVTGLSFTTGDQATLAATIRKLQADPAHAQRLAANARRHIEEKFSMTQTTNNYIALYDELLDHRQYEKITGEP